MGDIRARWCVDVEGTIAGAGERESQERCPWAGEKLAPGPGVGGQGSRALPAG